MECFEQNSTSVMERVFRDTTRVLGFNFTNFVLYSGGKTVSFFTKGIDKFQLDTIERNLGFTLSSISFFEKGMRVVMENEKK